MVYLAIKNDGSFHGYVSHIQRVTMVKDVDNFGFKLIIMVIYGLTASRFQVVELVSGSTQDDLVMCSGCFERR